MILTTNYNFWEFWAPYDPANGYFGEHKCIFDGAEKKIYINPEVTQLDVKADLYSDWKEWVMVRDNAKYLPAMRSIGGDPIGGGQYAGDLYFLINGWQIIIDHTVSMTGNLFSDDYDSPFVIVYGGVTSKVSNLAFAYNTTGGSTGPSAQQIWEYANRSLTASPTYNGPSAAQIRQEMDEYSIKLAQIKAILDSMNIPTPVEIRQEIDTNSTALQDIATKQGDALTKNDFIALS